MAILGALRADPGKVRHRTRIVMPEGMDLVLYYESKNSFVSARVATALRNKGVRQIRVLVGERIAEMKRLGIK